jgi:hypothetical protein
MGSQNSQFPAFIFQLRLTLGVIVCPKNSY